MSMTTPALPLEGRVAIVTGANHGIGAGVESLGRRAVATEADLSDPGTIPALLLQLR